MLDKFNQYGSSILQKFVNPFNRKISNPNKTKISKRRRIGTGPVGLIILDGLGISPDRLGNAVKLAKTPFLDSIWTNGISTTLNASGVFVGLPPEMMGNSEVGHFTIGTGTIVEQTLTKITNSINTGQFKNNKEIHKAIRSVVEKKSQLHIVGILSPGGVHGHIDHIFKIVDIANSYGVKPFIHGFMDGRDTGLNDGFSYVRLLMKLAHKNKAYLADICGRYYGMDRDGRWDRTEKAYRLIMENEGAKYKDPFKAISDIYGKGLNDQIFPPTLFINELGDRIGQIEDDDTIIFSNYREDRARQILKAISEENFSFFNRKRHLKNLSIYSMTAFKKVQNVHPIFSTKREAVSLSDTLYQHNKKQIHISETEKFAHITYFFNGGREGNLNLEVFYNLPSPKVADYSETPDMSAKEITEQLIYLLKNQNKNKPIDFFVCNYANPDMLGHTGNLEQTIKAVESVDREVAKVAELVIKLQGAIIIIADHGNCEYMIDKITGEKNTSHTNNPVPFIYADSYSMLSNSIRPDKIGEKNGVTVSPTGMLADVAPTILDIMNIEKPLSMDGESLFSLGLDR